MLDLLRAPAAIVNQQGTLEQQHRRGQCTALSAASDKVQMQLKAQFLHRGIDVDAHTAAAGR
jgi:hypothetical protein